MSVRFGQLVIGPPGSGKTTYCAGMKSFLESLGRKVMVVNLDPANEEVPYDSQVSISELIALEEVMQNLKLGPNGSLIYCMEFLEKNLQWLRMKLDAFKGYYFLFDCPGQVELYTHHRAVKNVTEELQKWGFKLVAVHLVDSHYCSDPSKFVSILLTSLATMVQLELPHVNVLSKVDLMELYGKLTFGLDYYTEVLELGYLLEHLSDDPFFKKYKKLNEALIGVVEDYSLVSFTPLCITDKETVLEVMKAVDKAGGYVYSAGEGTSSLASLLSVSVGADLDFFKSASVREKYLPSQNK
eukprot:Em0023g717a